MKRPIPWEQFEALQLEVGRILSVEKFPEAKKPAYIIAVDFGPTRGTLKTSAQLTQRYTPEDLIGKQIVGVTNFPKKQIGPMMSEFLVLGALDSKNGTAILQVLENVAPGTSIA
jgi:tRNA-binding protein